MSREKLNLGLRVCRIFSCDNKFTMVINSPPVPVDKWPKDLQPFNTTSVVPNTPLGKRNRRPPFYIQAGSVQPSTSPLSNVPFPLRKRMALLQEDTHDFIGDRMCELVGGVWWWYGNVTGSCMEDTETKLWSIKYDNDDKEEVTLQQLIMTQEKKICSLLLKLKVFILQEHYWYYLALTICSRCTRYFFCVQKKGNPALFRLKKLRV